MPKKKQWKRPVQWFPQEDGSHRLKFGPFTAHARDGSFNVYKNGAWCGNGSGGDVQHTKKMCERMIMSSLQASIAKATKRLGHLIDFCGGSTL